MLQKGTVDIDELFERAIYSLEAEIQTVRQHPSSDVLFNGVLQVPSAKVDYADYKFETHQPVIRFAEEIRATDGNREWLVSPVSYEKNEIILRFPEKAGNKLIELQVEWENDFVLQRTLQEVERLQSAGKAAKNRIRMLFEPEGDQVPFSGDLLSDGLRNDSQLSSIQKSMRNRTVFIWGPPGTGKTATLGYVIANYLSQGKRVLFASNTNRAVDVGLLSTLQALEKAEVKVDKSLLTRFGEPVLDEDPVIEVMFDQQIEKVVQKRQAAATEWSGLLGRQEEVKASIEKRLRDGNQPTAKQNLEMELIDVKIKKHGGREALEEMMQDLTHVNERIELKKKQLVAATMAKVCTSDLFYELDFDAVVIDEGSMASLPYLIVLASMAKWHRVIVGDPMQLPPIALTDDKESREFLERDIFTTVSGADTTETLFKWHDSHPEYTCFFDTQYRLEPSLADVISTVFYEGRLKSSGIINHPGAENNLNHQPHNHSGHTGQNRTDKKGPEEENRQLEKKGKQNRNRSTTSSASKESRGYHLIDTSRYKPVLYQKTGERGFKPVNEVHQEVMIRLIGNMLGQGIQPEEIGVMMPFRNAVYDFRTRLYEAALQGVEAGTIHTFQGREKPYIIFDTVMSGESQRGTVRHYSVRPLDEEKNGLSVPRLLNVAFSRSQKELMILADMRHVRLVYGNKFLGRLLERMRS